MLINVIILYGSCLLDLSYATLVFCVYFYMCIYIYIYTYFLFRLFICLVRNRQLVCRRRRQDVRRRAEFLHHPS